MSHYVPVVYVCVYINVPYVVIDNASTVHVYTHMHGTRLLGNNLIHRMCTCVYMCVCVYFGPQRMRRVTCDYYTIKLWLVGAHTHHTHTHTINPSLLSFLRPTIFYQQTKIPIQRCLLLESTNHSISSRSATRTTTCNQLWRY